MESQSLVVGNVWSEGLFGNDEALKAVSRLNDLADIDELDEAASTDKSSIVHSFYAPQCTSQEAKERVRKHLDSGVLHKLAAKMVANYFNPITQKDYTCHGFLPVILGACAMSHGCHTLFTAPGYKMFFKTYKDMLIGIFETAPLMDGAKEQMMEALLGADQFKPGSPIDFSTFALPDSPESARMKADPCMALLLGGCPRGYKSKRQGVGKGKTMNIVGPSFKEDMESPAENELCGGCKQKPGKPLVCGRCKDQKYCSKDCQHADYGRHKNVCRTPENAKAMKDDSSKWINCIYVSPESMPDLGSVAFQTFAGQMRGIKSLD